MTVLSCLGLLLLAIPLVYLYLLLVAAIRNPGPPSSRPAEIRFVIAIPAHDEETVIGTTVHRLRAMNYPAELFSIHVVADHCSDGTAERARQAGAVAHERNQGPRTGKGAALSWLFQQVLGEDCDAIVVFDSDTEVDPEFLGVMNARLSGGDRVVQGQHIISNPQAGWFPALTWAMFLIDNRIQNLGRSNLGWSAKHMGDSIAFRADVLRQFGWGEGLTEDYQLRQRLLLERTRIVYEPAAIGRGEAPRTWQQAQAQRARWLRGTRDAGKQYACRLLAEGIRRPDLAMLDGALQAFLPSYSTLTVIGIAALAAQLAANVWFGAVFSTGVVCAWAAAAGLLFVYPLLGLALARAPLRAYGITLSGPVFIVWRTWLALTARLGNKPVTWVRTAHGERK